jgi:hypothetical protein
MGSTWLLDDRGVALKATWRMSYGFINLSIWRDDRCVETFHLTPRDAANLIGFLVNGLAEVATAQAAAPVVALARVPGQVGRLDGRDRLMRLNDRIRSSLVGSLRNAADRLAR